MDDFPYRGHYCQPIIQPRTADAGPASPDPGALIEEANLIVEEHQ